MFYRIGIVARRLGAQGTLSERRVYWIEACDRADAMAQAIERGGAEGLEHITGRSLEMWHHKPEHWGTP